MKVSLGESSTRGRRAAVLLVVLAVASILSLGASPIRRPIPFRDSGVFLYIGQKVLDGKIPYLDVWDHKGPLVYWIDAMGLSLPLQPLWSVWLLQVIAIDGAALLGLLIITRVWGSTAALWASVLWLSTLPAVLEGGNLVEVFALPFQFLCIWAFLAWISSRRTLFLFVLGASGTCLLALRPNLVVLPTVASVVAAVMLVRTSPRRATKPLLCLAGGISTVVIPIALYFAWHGAFSTMTDCLFRYNLAYSSDGGLGVLAVIVRGFEVTAPTGLLPAALIGAAIALYGSLLPSKPGRGSELRPFHAFLSIAVLLEFVAASVAGRAHAHYFMAWLPVMAVLAGETGSLLVRQSRRPLGRAMRASALALFLIPASFHLVRDMSLSTKARQPDRNTQFMIDLIRTHTAPHETVLLWGAESTLNFLSGRDAPTRFVYQYALLKRGYTSASLFAGFLAELEANRPKLIIDTSATNDEIPPLDAVRRTAWSHEESDGGHASPPGMYGLDAFLARSYSGPFTLPSGWTTYVRIEANTR